VSAFWGHLNIKLICSGKQLEFKPQIIEGLKWLILKGVVPPLEI
jgi:hypothetical protein